jgi:Mg2+/Co2+ transporter CorB
MPPEMLMYLLTVLCLLILSAFFSGSETALTAVSRARMLALEQEGRSDARRVNALLAHPERVIGTVLLGNNLVNILASALTTSLLIGVFGDAGVFYATVAMTILVVVFSEVLPKTLALAYADRIALSVAPVMSGIIILLSPFTSAIALVVRLILKLIPGKSDDAANILAAHEELRGTIELSHRGGAVAKGDVHMLGGVLDLGELQVGDIMVHRTKMETVDAASPPAVIVEEVIRSQFTRVPVWRDHPENIVGVLHTKDMLAALAAAGWDVSRLDIMSFVTPPWFVPEQTSLKAQLNAFLKRKSHFALVVDEYGAVRGLLSLEDILEEIVGQIADEHDTGDVMIRPQSDGSVLVEGGVPVRDLNRQMEWDIPGEEATTVAGVVIHEAQTIPETGQTFNFHGYRFEVLRKSRNRITAMSVRPLSQAEAASAGQGGRERPIDDGSG